MRRERERPINIQQPEECLSLSLSLGVATSGGISSFGIEIPLFRKSIRLIFHDGAILDSASARQKIPPHVCVVSWKLS